MRQPGMPTRGCTACPIAALSSNACGAAIASSPTSAADLAQRGTVINSGVSVCALPAPALDTLATRGDVTGMAGTAAACATPQCRQFPPGDDIRALTPATVCR